MMTAVRRAPHPAVIVILCFLVAVFEGLDIQSMGIAAPRLARVFHLDQAMLGFVMSASTLGLMVGAALGGWISDRIGRRSVLLISMLMLGIFSLATSIAPDSAFLLAARFLAGIGLGGAFPNLIALIADTVPTRFRSSAMGFMYSGMPLGGAVAGLVMAGYGWQAVFHVGGWGPLALVPILFFGLPYPVRQAASAEVARSSRPAEGVVFGDRSVTTLLLWLSFFLTLFVVYTLLNWLPSLLLAKGLPRVEALKLSVGMNVGAALGGIVLGNLADRAGLRRIIIVTYTGMIAALILLALGPTRSLSVATFAVGFFVIGGQLVLYAIASSLYPTDIRGRGVGSAVAVGRAGSVAGPILAGGMLASGLAPDMIPLALVAGLGVAWLAILPVVPIGRFAGSGAGSG